MPIVLVCNCPRCFDGSSAIADIEASWVLRQQCVRLLTVVASSSRTAASYIGELTLPTLGRPSSMHNVNGGSRVVGKKNYEGNVIAYVNRPGFGGGSNS
ncbi:hypothetical protein P3T25_008861 [Paraburkholderia sp. GAS32]